jgi:multicomponent Na+:H+ antiporter subunit B
MISVLLQAAARYIVPIQILFSLYLLLRGHNLPGGGFIGGLIAAGALSLYVIAFDTDFARNKLRFRPQQFISTGLLISLISALLSMILGQPVMTGLWDGAIPLHWLGLGSLKLGTPLLFDIGVYLVVVGITMLIIFSLGEEN